MQMDTEENNRFLFLSLDNGSKAAVARSSLQLGGTYLPRIQKNEPINTRRRTQNRIEHTDS
jgi:hypothetical protein